jgi:succinoglycan biosynthesis transport protein ExoP
MTVEDQERPAITIRGAWLRLRRYRWWLLIFAFSGWLLATGASWLLPPKYRSVTVILIEQQKIPEHYVEPNVASDLNYRLQSMSEQILSRTRLLGIIQDFRLYGDEQGRSDADSLVARMRQNINIELVPTRRRDEFSAFKISFSDSNPFIAQKVTGELTSLFINENLRSRAQLSEDTTAFLENQLGEARKSLDVQEQRVREFRSSHLGQLPEQLQGNVQILGGLQNQLQAATDALHRAEQQRLFLQYQRRALAGSSSKGTEAGQPTSLPAIERKLEGLRNQLSELTANYTAQHPDVLKVKTEISATETARTRMLERLKSSTAAENGSASGAAISGDTSQGALLEGEQKANEMEIANATAKIRRLEAQIDEYRGRLNSAPMREQQLAAITRDYEQSRTYYESLLAKKLQSEMATSLEKRQQGEQFRMIDPPNLPNKPYWPNRLLFSLGGFAAGTALGFGLILLLEFASPRVYQDQELRNINGMNVLISVPRLLTDAERRRISWRWGLEAVAASAMLAVIGVGTLLVYYKG